MHSQELLQEYQEVFEGSPWYGSAVIKTLRRIPFYLVNQKIQPQAHSIAELLRHMLAWRTFVLEKLRENAGFDIELNSTADWEEGVKVHTEAEWEELLQLLEDSQQKMEQLLAGKSEEWLAQPVAGKPYANIFMLRGILYHDVYHLGQIRLIKKLLMREVEP